MEPHRPIPRKRSDPEPDSSVAGFCHVEQRGGQTSRHFVVHSRAPRFSVEVELETNSTGSRSTGVIRSVRMPNSWSGDYDRAGALLGPAVAFVERAHAVGARPLR